jgi:hypothetical protein
MLKHNLTLEQMHWRDWIIDNEIKRATRAEREEQFNEDYPTEFMESFLTKGGNHYTKRVCDQIEEGCEEPLVVGELVDVMGRTKIRRNRHGKFQMWRHPQEEYVPFITCDSGGGPNPHPEIPKWEPDPTCIDVWDRNSGTQLAQWHGQIDYGMIADVIKLVGDLYRVGRVYPVAAVELMNHGYTVVKDLTRMGYPQYEARPGVPGWRTDKSTKPLMADDLGTMAYNASLQILCKATVDEMRTFVKENNKFNAAAGCHDDRVDSAGIASQLMQLLPLRVNYNRSSYGQNIEQGTFTFSNAPTSNIVRDGYYEYKDE